MTESGEGAPGPSLLGTGDTAEAGIRLRSHLGNCQPRCAAVRLDSISLFLVGWSDHSGS
jgi:hypothetical protein